MKKFLAAMLAIMFTTLPVSAELEEEKASAIFAKDTEKFIASLPVSQSKYNSRQQPILIGGAMNSEIGVLVRALKNPVLYRQLNYIYIAGTYKNYPVVISRTEEFLPNAAATTALALANFNPVAVINQGTSGGYTSTLKPGDIVIGKRSINTSAIKTEYRAAGAGIDFTQQLLLGDRVYNKVSGKFESRNEMTADPTLLKLAEKISGFNAVTGTIGTADSWNNQIDYINFLNERYGVVCEEMETNAVADICYNSGVPFIGIRVISNNIVNGSAFQAESAEVAQHFVLALAEKYIQEVLTK